MISIAKSLLEDCDDVQHAQDRDYHQGDGQVLDQQVEDHGVMREETGGGKISCSIYSGQEDWSDSDKW